MPRNCQSNQSNHKSGRQPPGEDFDPEDREPERGNERIGAAHKLREEEQDEAELDDDDESSKEDEDYDEDYDESYGEDQTRLGDHRLSRLPDRDDDDAVTEADIMEVLDYDDLKQMDGPDA